MIVLYDKGLLGHRKTLGRDLEGCRGKRTGLRTGKESSSRHRYCM